MLKPEPAPIPAAGSIVLRGEEGGLQNPISPTKELPLTGPTARNTPVQHIPKYLSDLKQMAA